MKYRSVRIGCLTSNSHPVQGQCLAGSLTGAVASQRVTEAPKGPLSPVGNRVASASAQAGLTARTTVRAGTKVGTSDPVPVYGRGIAQRIKGTPKAIDLIIHKGRVGEVYNVGGHNEKQNIEIVRIICKELGKPESLITHVGDRKGHDMRYAIDPTKIHNELGWLPETKFEDGIKKTIQWYLDNREWWETIISGEYQNYYEKMYSNR